MAETTETVAAPRAVQPPALVTVTLYVVVIVGLTVMLAVVAPAFQRYVLPAVPLADSSWLPPLQIVLVCGVTTTGGLGTVTVTLAGATQPVVEDRPVTL